MTANEESQMAEKNEFQKQADKQAESVKDIPAHSNEQAVTRDTTPSVERPGHETEHPDRPKVQ